MTETVLDIFKDELEWDEDLDPAYVEDDYFYEVPKSSFGLTPQDIEPLEPYFEPRPPKGKKQKKKKPQRQRHRIKRGRKMHFPRETQVSLAKQTARLEHLGRVLNTCEFYVVKDDIGQLIIQDRNGQHVPASGRMISDFKANPDLDPMEVLDEVKAANDRHGMTGTSKTKAELEAAIAQAAEDVEAAFNEENRSPWKAGDRIVVLAQAYKALHGKSPDNKQLKYLLFSNRTRQRIGQYRNTAVYWPEEFRHYDVDFKKHYLLRQLNEKHKDIFSIEQLAELLPLPWKEIKARFTAALKAQTPPAPTAGEGAEGSEAAPAVPTETHLMVLTVEAFQMGGHWFAKLKSLKWDKESAINMGLDWVQTALAFAKESVSKWLHPQSDPQARATLDLVQAFRSDGAEDGAEDGAPEEDVETYEEQPTVPANERKEGEPPSGDET